MRTMWAMDSQGKKFVIFSIGLVVLVFIYFGRGAAENISSSIYVITDIQNGVSTVPLHLAAGRCPATAPPRTITYKCG